MNDDLRVIDVDQVKKIIDLLQKSLDEFKGLPHSLGYEFTHTPQLEQMIQRLEGLK